MRRLPIRMRRMATAAVAVAATTLVSGCEFQGVYDLPLPGGEAAGRDVYRVTVEFRDVLDLVPKASVRVNDVPVGAVEKVWLEGFTAKVRIRLLNSVQLPDNAEARIRMTSLLGEKFVHLQPPTGQPAEGRLSDGDLIPVSRTSRNIEVEEVLGAMSLLLNGGGVAQLKTITVELNKVMEGREDRIKSFLANLDTFVGELDEQKADIVRALEGIDRLSKTLNAQRDTITGALDQVGPGLKVLADQRKQLVQMLEALAELGNVSARVIRQSKADTVADLRLLVPILTRLADAGSNLPKSLEMLATYPFPDAAVGGIKGDYTNLHAKIRFDLQEIYGNLTSDPGERSGGGPLPIQPPGVPDLLGDPLPQVPGDLLPRSSATPQPGLGDLLIGGLR